METEQKHSSKRKRVVLTLEDKLDVIRLKEKGLSFDLICRQYNIGTTTIKDIMKKRVQIEEAVEKQRLLGLEKSKKTLTESRRPDVEMRLYDWISEKLENNELITNTDILVKAQELSMEIYQEVWKASKGWLTKFKRRYNLMGIRLDAEIEESVMTTETIEYDTKLESTNEENLSTENNDTEEIRIEMTPLDAAEYLLNYVTNNGSFPLKEIITLQMIRDRIAELEQPSV